MFDTKKLLEAAGYVDRFRRISARVIEEKAHEFTCDHLYDDRQHLTYTQARAEIKERLDGWIKENLE